VQVALQQALQRRASERPLVSCYAELGCGPRQKVEFPGDHVDTGASVPLPALRSAAARAIPRPCRAERQREDDISRDDRIPRETRLRRSRNGYP
jgi:hypothetical protein